MFSGRERRRCCRSFSAVDWYYSDRLLALIGRFCFVSCESLVKGRSLATRPPGINHLPGHAVSTVVAMLAVCRRLASKIASQITDAAHGGLSISHHTIKPVAIVSMAVLVLLQKCIELIVAGE